MDIATVTLQDYDNDESHCAVMPCPLVKLAHDSLVQLHSADDNLVRQPDVSRNALSFTDEFFLSFFFYRTTVLSSRGEATHQMYTGGSFICTTTINDP